MSIAQAIRGTGLRAARRCGGGNTVTIRRDGKGIVSASTGKALTSLLVAGTKAIGSATITLDAASIQAKSVLGQGWRFTLAGHTAPYEVQADVEVASNAFTNVSISPVLSHEATDNAVATLSRLYGEWTFSAFRRGFEQAEMDERWEADDYVLVIPIQSSSFAGFSVSDAVAWDGKRRSVIRQMPIKPGDDLAVLRLHCRG